MVDAGWALVQRDVPEPSLLGLGLAIASVIVMPVLFVLKYRLGRALESRSLIADSKETLACVLLSAALLVGLGTFHLWRVWWIDSVSALVIAVLILREGVETLKESRESIRDR